MTRIFLILLLLVTSNLAYGETAKSTVILLSVDGFSFSYLQKYHPKNILAFANSGASAPLQPVYPSKTFPNHLSIITGTYPVNHGIIHNKFYHPTLEQKYYLNASKDNNTWLTATPFWSVVENNSIKSAVYFWPELEGIGHTPPSYSIPYNKSTSNKARVDQLIQWLKLPHTQRPYFIASYFSSIDSAGHYYGIDSLQLARAIKEFDTLFGYFLNRIKREIPQPVNIILVSDHGMVPIAESAKIQSDPLFKEIKEKEKGVTVTYSDTQIFIYFDKNKVPIKTRKAIANQLLSNQLTNKKLYSIHSKGKYPQHWRFNAQLAIIPDIIIEAIPPATFIWQNKSAKFHGATHGYDPQSNKRLHGIFIAVGPNIIHGRQLDPFENIHIFPFMNALLGFETALDVDGRKSVLQSIIQ